MRYLVSSVVLLFSLMACKQGVKGKNGVTYKSAVQYSNYIVSRQTTLMKNVPMFGKMLGINIDSAEIILRHSALEAEKMIGEIKGMPVYKGDSALREAAVQSFYYYKRLFEKDYMDVVTIQKKGKENLTDEDAIEINRIIDKISKDEQSVEEIFSKVQRSFADKNNIKIIENKAQDGKGKEQDSK